jgi:S1-C subfamily serine protease
VFLLAILVAGRAYPQAPSGGDDLVPVNDSALLARLTESVSDMYQSGRATPTKALIEGLARTRTALTLGPPDTRALTPAEAYQKARQSIVIIGVLYRCPECGQLHVSTASGFFISASGAVATNYHVVNNSDGVAMGAMAANGSFFAVKEVLAASRADDVAILAVQGAGLPPLALSAGEPVGSSVFVVSHPSNRFFTFSTGVISRYFSEKNGSAVMARMAITADYARGSSGAPVLNGYGAVVGMVCTTSSIYYTEKDDGTQKDLQMVVKSCIPARAILRLVQGGSQP